MNRRTLSVALQTGKLTEQALDFVKAGSVRREAELQEAPVPPTPVESPRPIARDVNPRLRLSHESEGESEAGLVSLTVRVPRGVPPALLLASMDRKLRRQRPWTQQEIVAEALTLWLRQHGY